MAEILSGSFENEHEFWEYASGQDLKTSGQPINSFFPQLGGLYRINAGLARTGLWCIAGYVVFAGYTLYRLLPDNVKGKKVAFSYYAANHITRWDQPYDFQSTTTIFGRASRYDLASTTILKQKVDFIENAVQSQYYKFDIELDLASVDPSFNAIFVAANVASINGIDGEVTVDDWEIVIGSATETYCKENGIWKPAEKFVKHNNIWKPAETRVRHNNTWKDV